MSGTAPTIPSELPADAASREAMAGEYVLGTLDARLSERVTAALLGDVAWREAVAAWEERLAPLAALARTEAPPANVWDRIEERIAPAEAPRQKRERQWAWMWRVWAVAASLAVAGAVAYIVTSREDGPRLLTMLVGDRNAPGVLAEMDRKGNLNLTLVPAVLGRQLQAPSGKSLQVWSLVQGQQFPTNVALLPYEPGRNVMIPATRITPVAGMQIMITVEPDGGSPTGRPTGQVLLIGRLSAVARPS